MLAIANPFDYFSDLNGDALDGGTIYYGLPNQDPIQYPKAVFFDSAMTIPAPQPLKTVAGYIVRNGSPTYIFTANGSYSILVLDKHGRQIYFVADVLLIGNQAAVTNKYNPVVNSIADLRLLDKTQSFNAFANGYYAATDGGGGHYWLDVSDTTSADNGGTIIVGADGGRWKLATTESVSVKQFGAKGDGSNDDTGNIQAAINYMANQLGELYFPAGTYKVTSPLTSTYPVQWRGEGNGVTTFNNFTTKGSTILSTVTTDYVVKLNDGGGFQRGLRISNMRFAGAGTALHGMLIHGMGWDGRMTDVCFDQFTGKCMRLTTVQDTVFTNVAFLFSTTAANANYAVEISASSNYLRFSNCRIEGCSRVLSADTNTFDVIFNGAHIEIGDYTGAPNLVYNRNYTAPPIAMDSSQAILFSACTFVPDSNDTLLANNGGTLASQPFFVSTTSCDRVEFNNNFIHAPQKGIKFWTNKSATGWSGFRGNQVSGADCRTKCLDVDQTTVSNNQFAFFDDGVTTIFEGINVNQKLVLGNEFTCFNPSSATKTSGYIINTSSARGTTALSANKVAISKYYKVSAKPFETNNDEGKVYFGLGGGSVTVDLEIVLAGQWLVFTVGAATLTSITNAKDGQEVIFYNISGANCTINAVVGQIVPKNGLNVTIPQNGIITFGSQDDGILYEISRSF